MLDGGFGFSAISERQSVSEYRDNCLLHIFITQLENNNGYPMFYFIKSVEKYVFVTWMLYKRITG